MPPIAEGGFVEVPRALDFYKSRNARENSYITIAKRTVIIYRPNKPKLNLEGFLMNHFLLLEMQE